jgi:hypothetical protein
MPSQIVYDEKDRQALRKKLKLCINPLMAQEHPLQLVDIVTRRINPETVNVDDALAIGTLQRQEFESSWPEGFHKPIANRVKTMVGNQRRHTSDKKGHIGCKLVFSRLMILIQYRDIDVRSVMKYELAPIPTSLFDGTKNQPEMRIAKAKATIKRALQVEHSSRVFTSQPDAVFLEACAIMWIVHWSSKDVFKDYVDGFVNYVLSKLTIVSNVFVIFDRCKEKSIKGNTRAS